MLSHFGSFCSVFRFLFFLPINKGNRLNPGALNRFWDGYESAADFAEEFGESLDLNAIESYNVSWGDAFRLNGWQDGHVGDDLYVEN